jgi:hypothetical protein
VLELALKAFPRERHVEWFLAGARRGELEVAGGWRRYELPLGLLAPGDADPRPLGLALGSWRFDTQDETPGK